MESAGFDTMTKRLVTRRTGAGLAFVGLLSVAGQASARKKKKKTCKTPCGRCETCIKGTCTATPGQRACGASCIASDICCTDDVLGCIGGTTCIAGACLGCWDLGVPCVAGTTQYNCCSGVCSGSGTCSCYTPGQSCSKNQRFVSGRNVHVCAPGQLCSQPADCCKNTCVVGVCQ